MKRLLSIVPCVAIVGLLLPASSMAATEAQKQAAIDAGLVYLAGQQSVDGSWPASGLDYRISSTGASLLSFLEEKDNWGANAAAYQTVVNKGLSYLLSNAEVVDISLQAHGNPDADGNGVGVNFYPGTSNRDTYVTGLVLPAIASSGTPDALVTVGPLATRTDGTGAGGAWTYKDVVQNTIDYFAFGQNEGSSPGPRGGWRYWANYGDSDQSTTQWPVIAGLFAGKMGVSLPGWVEDELAIWTDYIQDPATGAAGYTSPTNPLGELNETGALLTEQASLGWGTGDARVQAALDYINDHWQEIQSGTWDGNFGHPYAMWAIYKGLSLMIGVDDETTITNLHADPGDVDNPDHGWNWWEDYNDFLVNNQSSDGSWAGYSYWNSMLATPWYINILAATEVGPGPGPGPGPGSVPEAATILLLGTGLIGLAGFRRKFSQEVI